MRLHRGDYDDVVERADEPVALARRLGRRRARDASISSTSTARAAAACGPSSCAQVPERCGPVPVAGLGRDPQPRRRAGAARRRRRPGRRRHRGLARPDAVARARRRARARARRRATGRCEARAGRRRRASPSTRRSSARQGARVLVTAIDRDGTLAGPDLELVGRAAAAGLRVLAAGGVRSPSDVDGSCRNRRRSRRRRPCAPYGVARLSPPSTTSRWPFTYFASSLAR